MDDLAHLQHVHGKFDSVNVFGVLNDMSQQARDCNVENVLPLISPGGNYIMICFERMLSPEGVEARFGEYFTIEVLETRPNDFPRMLSLYRMRRLNQVSITGTKEDGI